MTRNTMYTFSWDRFVFCNVSCNFESPPPNKCLSNLTPANYTQGCIQYRPLHRQPMTVNGSSGQYRSLSPYQLSEVFLQALLRHDNRNSSLQHFGEISCVVEHACLQEAAYRLLLRIWETQLLFLPHFETRFRRTPLKEYIFETTIFEQAAFQTTLSKQYLFNGSTSKEYLPGNTFKTIPLQNNTFKRIAVLCRSCYFEGVVSTMIL